MTSMTITGAFPVRGYYRAVQPRKQSDVQPGNPKQPAETNVNVSFGFSQNANKAVFGSVLGCLLAGSGLLTAKVAVAAPFYDDDDSGKYGHSGKLPGSSRKVIHGDRLNYSTKTVSEAGYRWLRFLRDINGMLKRLCSFCEKKRYIKRDNC